MRASSIQLGLLMRSWNGLMRMRGKNPRSGRACDRLCGRGRRTGGN